MWDFGALGRQWARWRVLHTHEMGPEKEAYLTSAGLAWCEVTSREVIDAVMAGRRILVENCARPFCSSCHYEERCAQSNAKTRQRIEERRKKKFAASWMQRVHHMVHEDPKVVLVRGDPHLFEASFCPARHRPRAQGTGGRVDDRGASGEAYGPRVPHSSRACVCRGGVYWCYERAEETGARVECIYGRGARIRAWADEGSLCGMSDQVGARVAAVVYGLLCGAR